MRSGDLHRDEERIFGEALSRSAADRAAFLVSACAGDASLLHRVSQLLQEHEQSVNALDHSPGGELRALMVDASTVPQPSEAVASHAGRYVLGDKLGEGGWGVVYAAEQLHPVRRHVAIKIIKLGMDTRSIVARFQAERQALALMEHENIARVFDAGETAQGRPFFAMELVRGTRITTYCDEHRLTLRERLELFIQVCDAVQHAHQKGVIHRDLKPSNILVVGTGATARPKIIDFGIAKATRGRLGEETVVTERDGFVGTPAYMSPEQADQREDAIDTRSDIYSLGVILYELLSGCTPLEALSVHTVGVDEVRRQIREREPVRPSLRVARLRAAAAQEIAEHRRSSAAKLGDLLRGDLDRVVLKCLEKGPARRYESASALAQDLWRFLHHEPVTAGPAGQWYVWGKFVRRHRVAFGIAGGIVVLLVTGVTVSTILLFRERAARERAMAAEHAQAVAREAAETASRQAKTEATRSARATEFMTSVFNSVKPAVARGRDKELLREVLDEAAGRLDSALADEPEVEAELRDVIGEAFWNLDEPVRAARMHRRALALHEQIFGPMHARVGFTLIRLGLFEMYHGNVADAERNFRRAADIRAHALGPEDPRTLDAHFFTVESLIRQLRFAEATELLDQLRATQTRVFPSDDLRLLRTEFMLANLLHRDGFTTRGEQTLRGVIARYPADTKGQVLSFFRDQPLDSLANMLVEQGRIDEALETFREGRLASTAQGHPNFGSEVLMAYALHRQARCAEAVNSLRATTESIRQIVNRDRSRSFVRLLAMATTLQGECLAHLGQGAEAEPLLREATALSWAPNTVINRHPAFALARVLRARGDPAAADAALEDALRRANESGNEFVFQLFPAVYRSLQAAHRTDRAEEHLRDLIASEASRTQQDGPVAAAPYSLAVLCAAAEVGAMTSIAPIVRERLAWWQQQRPTQAPVFAFSVLAAEMMVREGEVALAERTLLTASEGLEQTKPYWRNDELPWRAEYLQRALHRFYRAARPAGEQGAWRERIADGNFDPEWALLLAGALFEAGRHSEVAEILPAAKARLEAILARKPDNDRLAALMRRATDLGDKTTAAVSSRTGLNTSPSL